MYDIEKIRKDFPMLQNKTMQNKPLVYLDNASTTFKPQCVIDACNDYYLNYNANSHRGDYDIAYYVDKKVSEVRETIAKFINSNTNEVVFTSGDTQALNIVAYGYGLKHLKKDDEILISEAEHASNVLPWFKVAELTGAKIKYIPLAKNGAILPENVAKAVSNKTKIVSIAHVGNVLGYVVDIKKVAEIVHAVNALIVVDGAQSVPHMKTDFKDLDIDFLTFSAHKMLGPTGIGCLVGKYHLLEMIDPFIVGGGNNERFYKDTKVSYLNPPSKFEAGTLNLSGIFGFEAAIKYINDIGIDNIREHEKELIRYVHERLKDQKDIIIYNPDSESGILTFNRRGVFAQDEATLLNYQGIAIRSGEHCDKLLTEFLKTNATCRMSTYLYTTKEEVDIFIDALIAGGDILDAYFN